MDEFQATGKVTFSEEVRERYQRGFLSNSATDQQTLALINEIYAAEDYLLDPHGAVSLQACDALQVELGPEKLICLATAHPAKFPLIIKQALNVDQLPQAATHHSIERDKTFCQKVHLCEYAILEPALRSAMLTNWELTKGQ